MSTQNTDAERAVLGALILQDRRVPDVSDILRPADFYHPRHETIYDAILSLWNRKIRVDLLSLREELRKRGERGDDTYLHDLTEHVQIAANATYHAELVLEAALRRRLEQAGHRIIQSANDATDAAQAAQDAQQAVAEAASQARTADAGGLLADSLDGAMDWLETKPEGADTPWPDVNSGTNGLLAGAMITCAARPGGGKSLVAKDVAVFTAKQGKPVHVATLEMSRQEYMARILAAEATVNLGKMLRREMTEQEWERVSKASARVRDLPLVLDDRERQSMAQIRAAARQTARRLSQLGLIAIDYARLVQPEDRRAPREQQVAGISRDTKMLAKEFGCPVLLLAQLNRNNSGRSDPTPMVTDLRESGALEQDSDMVWLLHRPDQYGHERLGEVDLIVGKNRNGPAPKTIRLAFQGHYARITSLV